MHFRAVVCPLITAREQTTTQWLSLLTTLRRRLQSLHRRSCLRFSWHKSASSSDQISYVSSSSSTTDSQLYFVCALTTGFDVFNAWSTITNMMNNERRLLMMMTTTTSSSCPKALMSLRHCFIKVRLVVSLADHDLHPSTLYLQSSSNSSSSSFCVYVCTCIFE